MIADALWTLRRERPLRRTGLRRLRAAALYAPPVLAWAAAPGTDAFALVVIGLVALVGIAAYAFRFNPFLTLRAPSRRALVAARWLELAPALTVAGAAIPLVARAHLHSDRLLPPLTAAALTCVPAAFATLGALAARRRAHRVPRWVYCALIAVPIYVPIWLLWPLLTRTLPTTGPFLCAHAAALPVYIAVLLAHQWHWSRRAVTVGFDAIAETLMDGDASDRRVRPAGLPRQHAGRAGPLRACRRHLRARFRASPWGTALGLLVTPAAVALAAFVESDPRDWGILSGLFSIQWVESPLPSARLYLLGVDLREQQRTTVLAWALVAAVPVLLGSWWAPPVFLCAFVFGAGCPGFFVAVRSWKAAAVVGLAGLTAFSYLDPWALAFLGLVGVALGVLPSEASRRARMRVIGS